MSYEITNDSNVTENIEENIYENVMATIPVYPGYVLTIGSAGTNVSIMQSYLNAIKTGMFPALNRLVVDGVYGQRTKNTVMQYQGFSGLKQDGIIGKETWDSIVADYESLPIKPADDYPGYVLRPGASGNDVRIMQLKLNNVNPVYTAINYQSVDGKYGSNMANAVRRFQAQFGLVADGIIGQKTWDKIVTVSNGVSAQSNTNVSSSYPGYILNTGSQGDSVRFIQSYLNAVSKYTSAGWPTLAVDGIYGRMTKQVVKAFQTKFGLKADGIVGRDTWAVIVKQFNDSL